MRVVITGKNGQLGIELQHQLEKINYIETYSFDSNEMNITNREKVESQLKRIRPHIVINCAAYTAVDLCENYQEHAYQVNVLGAKYLAQICSQIGAKMIYISTDYVFSGNFNINEEVNVQACPNLTLEWRRYQASKSKAWVEEDVLSPQNVYGKTKAEGEEMVCKYCLEHFIIRTAWLYGEGKNFVRTILRLSENQKELNIVADQFGNPTSTKELARVIIDLMQTDYYGTYHATCEGVCSWYDFACKILEIKGIDIKINAITSEELERPAKRPYYSALENKNLKDLGLNTFKTWEEALEEYLEKEL